MSLLARLFPWLTSVVLGLIIWGLHNQLTAEQDFRSSVQAQLHAPKNDPATLSAYLTGKLEALQLAQAMLDGVDKDAKAAKARSDASDAQLAADQKQNLARFDAIHATLADLKNHKTAGNPDADCKQIELDSELPWKGWHQ